MKRAGAVDARYLLERPVIFPDAVLESSSVNKSKAKIVKTEVNTEITEITSHKLISEYPALFLVVIESQPGPRAFLGPIPVTLIATDACCCSVRGVHLLVAATVCPLPFKDLADFRAGLLHISSLLLS